MTEGYALVHWEPISVMTWSSPRPQGLTLQYKFSKGHYHSEALETIDRNYLFRWRLCAHSVSWAKIKSFSSVDFSSHVQFNLHSDYKRCCSSPHMSINHPWFSPLRCVLLIFFLCRVVFLGLGYSTALRNLSSFALRAVGWSHVVLFVLFILPAFWCREAPNSTKCTHLLWLIFLCLKNLFPILRSGRCSSVFSFRGLSLLLLTTESLNPSGIALWDNSF